jgi:hypothetical protein
MFEYGLNTAKSVRLTNDLKPGYIKEPQSYPSKADSQLWKRMKVKIQNCNELRQFNPAEILNERLFAKTVVSL